MLPNFISLMSFAFGDVCLSSVYSSVISIIKHWLHRRVTWSLSPLISFCWQTGAPGYITSTFLNGMSFVEGWEQNFFISKWSMHQLVWRNIFFLLFMLLLTNYLFTCCGGTCIDIHTYIFIYQSICFYFLFACNIFLTIEVFMIIYLYLVMFQLIECPSIYELMACLDFDWEHIPLLELWREMLVDGNSRTILETYPPHESVEIFKEALSSNTVIMIFYPTFKFFFKLWCQLPTSDFVLRKFLKFPFQTLMFLSMCKNLITWFLLYCYLECGFFCPPIF